MCILSINRTTEKSKQRRRVEGQLVALLYRVRLKTYHLEGSPNEISFTTKHESIFLPLPPLLPLLFQVREQGERHF